MSSVIETIRQILTECELMDEFNGVHVDYTESGAGNAGIFPTNPRKISEDLVGNQRWQINFSLLVDRAAYEDYDRLANSDFLLQLTYYMNSQKNISVIENVNGTERSGKITNIAASNALLFAVPTGDINDGVRYSLQLQVTYMIYE